MPVVFDANVLIDLFNDRLQGDRRAKLDNLVETLRSSRTQILIPTPSLTELLVRAGRAGDTYVGRLQKSKTFVIAPFDQRASVECALLLKDSWSKGEHKKVSHSKFKFDWQIVSIAASRGATAIYSDDGDVARAGLRRSIPVHAIDSLAVPDSARQPRLPFDQSNEGDD